MKKGVLSAVVLLALICPAQAPAADGCYDLGVNSSLAVATITGIPDIPPGFGPRDQYYAFFRIGPVVSGKRYEATLGYESGSDTGFGMAWVDGDPKQKYASFLGIGSQTGTGQVRPMETKYLFSIDPRSTSDVLFLVIRSDKPWNIKMTVADRATVTRDSRDRWGFYNVTDFDFDKNSPFLLKRGGRFAAADKSFRFRILGPFSFQGQGMRGTIRIAQISESQGAVWLSFEGGGTEEVVNVEFQGEEFKFTRTLDCRQGYTRPVRQNFTGTVLSDSAVQGAYTRDDQPSALFPWQAQK